MRPPLRLAACLALAAALLGAGHPVLPLRSSDGREVYRCVISLTAPEQERVNVQGGSILAFNRAGRLFFSHAFDTGEYAEWCGRRTSLAPGEQLMFTRQERFEPVDEPARLLYVFRVGAAGAKPVRLMRQFALGQAIDGLPAELTEPAEQPRLEICTAPDRVEGLRQPRTGRLVWPFSLWAQETGGAAVTLSSAEWVARGGNGQALGEAHLDAAALRALVGREPVCGPDGYLELPGQAAATAEAATGQMVVMLEGAGPDGAVVKSMARVELTAPVPRPAQTVLRLPVSGDWRVRLGPGAGPNRGAALHTWVCEAVDRKGRAFGGQGRALRDWVGYGRPVLAPAAGVVSLVVTFHPDADVPQPDGTFSGGRGENCVVIDHGNGESSYLGGLLRESLRVRPGMNVAAGLEVGRVGNSCAERGQPGLTYRLVRSDSAGRRGLTLEARFAAYQHLAPGEPQRVAGGAPETGDSFHAP